MSDTAQVTRAKNAANVLAVGSVTQAQSTELVAAAGAVTVDAAPPPPPPPITGQWENLVVGTPFDEGSAYWTDDCFNAVQNSILVPGFQGRTGSFSLSTGLTSPVSGGRWGNVENYALAHDPVGHRYFVEQQTPSNATFNGASGYFADTDPGVAAGFTTWRYAGTDGQVGIAQGYYISVGSWSSGANPSGSNMIAVTRLSDMASFNAPFAGVTVPNMWGGVAGLPWQEQCMIDSRDGTIYLYGPSMDFGTTGALYKIVDVLAVVQGTKTVATVSKVATTGTLPPLTTVFALDESTDTIVGWCGLDKVVTDGTPAPQTGQAKRQTYLLPLATNAWSAPTLAGSLPPAEVLAYTCPMYDSVGKRVILTIHGSGTGLRVWGFKLG